MTDNDVDDSQPVESLDIGGLETLKVLADSLRMRIVDFLRREAATVKELAAALQVSPKSLYYHMALLEKHSLVKVVDTRLVSGIIEKRYRATAYLFNFHDIAAGSDASPVQRRAQAVASLFTMTENDIRLGLASGMIDPREDAPPVSNLSLEWTLLNLPPDAARELSERLTQIVQEFAVNSADHQNGQPYRLLWTLFPTFQRGQRPDPGPLTDAFAGQL